MSRLRKTLAGVLPEETANCHLHRDKGMIWLAHCRARPKTFHIQIRYGFFYPIRITADVARYMEGEIGKGHSVPHSLGKMAGVSLLR